MLGSGKAAIVLESTKTATVAEASQPLFERTVMKTDELGRPNAVVTETSAPCETTPVALDRFLCHSSFSPLETKMVHNFTETLAGTRLDTFKDQYVQSHPEDRLSDEPLLSARYSPRAHKRYIGHS